MKTKYWILFAALFFFSGTFSSQTIEDLQKMSPEQRKEYINKLSPSERKKLIERYRENMIIDDLELPKEKQEDFRQLYKEYQESQRTIVKRVKSSEDYRNMSEKQAKDELEQSFSLGQQLMDNRKKYTERFQKIMTPQQVLRMYDTEAMMREKMIERRNNSRSRGEENSRSNQRNMRNENMRSNDNNTRNNNTTASPRTRTSTRMESSSPRTNTGSSTRTNSPRMNTRGR